MYGIFLQIFLESRRVDPSVLSKLCETDYSTALHTKCFALVSLWVLSCYSCDFFITYRNVAYMAIISTRCHSLMIQSNPAGLQWLRLCWISFRCCLVAILAKWVAVVFMHLSHKPGFVSVPLFPTLTHRINQCLALIPFHVTRHTELCNRILFRQICCSARKKICAKNSPSLVNLQKLKYQ